MKFCPTRNASLPTLLLAAAVVPLGALDSAQRSYMPLDKPVAVSDGSECYRNYATDPRSCPIVQVAFFEDTHCSEPLNLVRTNPQAFIKGNEQMLFDGAVAHSLKNPFGSMRVLAAVDGIGIGFAKSEESDMVVQNMAWLSSSQTQAAFKSKQCINFPNLDVSQVKVWTVKADGAFNRRGYAWNPYNIPITKSPQCTDAPGKLKTPSPWILSSKNGAPKSQPASATGIECLEKASWGGGGVLLMYASDDCSGSPKRQLYSTAQCTPLAMTNFKSYKAIQPQGPTIDTVFSPAYYDVSESGYHACAQRDVSARPFKPNECQKVAGNDMFVGVYGVDAAFPPPVPGPHNKVLLQSHGHLLLSPNPKHQKHTRR
ncbi:hypothetical protein EX895_000071 [Sporisorium graminicola]|uniref:Uncharacterized protein n=1 Tax=Sporisorium graminicola TaxID=280036 RepID=A0A4U7KZ61_9BASI|nr:hypothetical protein EX895_000071 [Sporisorium graminicola]TKY90073.1 hypothetical protein EX895_000071 [Sporisorium graminicola]